MYTIPTIEAIHTFYLSLILLSKTINNVRELINAITTPINCMLHVKQQHFSSPSQPMQQAAADKWQEVEVVGVVSFPNRFNNNEPLALSLYILYIV